MEIPELSLISNFEVGVNCLQNPSLFSRILSLSGNGKLPHEAYSFCKWGALILALLATLRCIIVRVKVLIIGISNRVKLLASSEPPIKLFEDDDFDSDEEDDASSSASTDDEDGFWAPTSLFHSRAPGDEEDFSVAGSNRYGGGRWRSRDSTLRRRRNCNEQFSWPDFAAGKGVVRFWDNLGLGFDFEEDFSDNVVSLWDLNKDRKISSFHGGRLQIPAVSMASPAVILSAASSNDGNVKFRAYDRRAGLHTPSIYAEWRPPRRSQVVGINANGVEKVYAVDDTDSVLTVGDMRNAKAPLENLTESDGDTWWDADAVIVPDEFLDG